MKRIACEHEDTIVRAVLTRRWPDGCDEELRRHAESCDTCAEVLLVAAALGDDHDDALRDVHVPAAGQVWWRSALRAHAEAATAARRPLIWLQGIAGACAIGLGVALLGLGWSSLRDAAQWLSATGSDVVFDASNLTRLVESFRPAILVLLAIAGCLVLAPLVVYFALSDD